jgi:hypothetical protein
VLDESNTEMPLGMDYLDPDGEKSSVELDSKATDATEEEEDI